MRLHYWEPDENFDTSKLESSYERRTLAAGEPLEMDNVTQAKLYLTKYGGIAYTRHCERDGSCFEVTPIKLGKNNSTHRYNRHL